MTEKPGGDQIYFSISDNKNSSEEEQLTDDSQSIPNSLQVSTVSLKNISISHIATEFVTKSLCGSISKADNLILMLNTGTPSYLIIQQFHQFHQIAILLS